MPLRDRSMMGRAADHMREAERLLIAAGESAAQRALERNQVVGSMIWTTEELLLVAILNALLAHLRLQGLDPA